MTVMRPLLLVVIFAVVSSADGLGQDGSVFIQNLNVKVVAAKVGEVFQEQYFARQGDDWILLLQAGNPARPDPEVKLANTAKTGGFQLVSANVSRTQKTLLLEMKEEGWQVQRTVTLDGDNPFVRVQTTFLCRDSVRMNCFLATYSFVPDGKMYASYKPLDFVFTPNLRPEQDEIIGDHVFRSPALMMQEGHWFASLVPDVSTIDGKERPIRAAADVQVETSDMPMISFGLMTWAKKGHVYYSRLDSVFTALPDRKASFGYFIYVSASAEPAKGFQNVVRYLWTSIGHEQFLRSVGPQQEPFSSYVEKAWHKFVPQVALTSQYEGREVTLLRQSRLAWSNNLPKAADNDNWFNVWFNSLRTAYGMRMYAEETKDDQLKRQAVGNLNLALLAPRNKGLAPSIFYLDSTGGHWVADQAWGGIDSGRSDAMFHNAWTNYWLLQWSDLEATRKAEIYSVACSFGDFLVSHQQSSGVIPSWYDSETLQPASQLRDENAETAGAALFLAELNRRTGEKRYLETAERAMNYIFSEILPQRKWFDYETFFSCSRKPIDTFDRFTQQYPQNTLSMQQAAEACYELFKLTGKAIYREHGIEIMDYLCLYQQVWSPRWLSCELFGGFGVQNTDGEWSDSRQGYFAVTLMNYYELTGQQEYFERGVAALRAMFSLFESADSPRTAENYAHGATDHLAGVTGLHWGTGSSVVSIHILRQRYGGAYVNVKDKWGAGIDGCRIDRVQVQGSTVRLDLLNNLSVSHSVRLTVHECTKPRYTIVVNGQQRGTFTSEQLRKGIDVAF